ncbi:NADP-dependent isocitrate dehydrogenase, partial [candidate division TA06 bacterium]|nr:NADP-dependent isocitrate dehydrogenase [candidate division TA06 bacterium]
MNKEGNSIQIVEGKLSVPDYPIIPFIEGDGVGPEIMKAAKRIWEKGIEVAYGDQKKIVWLRCSAGEKALAEHGDPLPEETVETIRKHIVAIKSPLTTPVGGGYRSLNVTLRQTLDLYACVRPVHYFEGVPSPVVHPERMDVVIFRENTEDVYAGIEWPKGSQEVEKLISFVKKEFDISIREDSGIGIKPISERATKRLVRKALQYAIDQKRRSVTLVHKGNIMKYTEGAFRDWGYDVAKKEFECRVITEKEVGHLRSKASATERRSSEPG